MEEIPATNVVAKVGGSGGPSVHGAHVGMERVD